MQLSKFASLVFLAWLSDLYVLGQPTTELKAEFAKGLVKFSQEDDFVVISLHDDVPLQKDYKLTIHNFPIQFDGPMNQICKEERVGGIFDPTSALGLDYDSKCTSSNRTGCAVGDISGKFKDLYKNKKENDKSLALSGKESIFGRSLVIQKANGDFVACTTITSTTKVKSVVGVFHAVSPGIAGTIVLRQSEDDPDSDTSVDMNLMLVDARSETKKGLSLAVHNTKTSDENKMGSCSGIDKMFNPFDTTSCDKRNHKTCPVGDLYAKLGPIQVIMPGAGSPRAFYIDSNLPLSGENSIVGQSLVISENGRPLICAEIQEYQVFVGEAVLEEGVAKFSQGSIHEPVVVNISAHYSVSFNRGLDSTCTLTNGAGSWKNLTVSVSGRADGLTLYGPNSIMFQRVLVKNGAKEICTTVKPKDTMYQLKAAANFTRTGSNPLTGIIHFEQAVFNTSKAFAFISSIIVDLKYLNNTKKTQDHDWHVHQLPVSGVTLENQLVNVKGHYNPYKVYVKANSYAATCNAGFPFRCELGDLSNKLGTYSIGEGMKQCTETENYLASWHNILGRSVVIHAKDKGAGRIACADILPQQHSSYSQGSLICRNTSKTRDKTEFQNTVSEALSVSSWRVANAKFEGIKEKPNCLKYSFSLIDDSKSNLHQAFTDVVADNPGKLKDFTPACGDSSSEWRIDDGNTDEVVGVIVGVIALIVLIIAIVYWLRRKHQDEEQNAKLVVEDGNTATNSAPSVESGPKVISNKATEVGIEIESSEEKDPNGLTRKDSAKEYKVTTSL